MKNLLITGGCGYIGSQLTFDFQKFQKDYNIFVVDNLSNGKKELISKKVFFYKINLLNEKKIRIFIKKNKIDTIIHLAGHTNARESMINKKKYIKNNYLATKKLLIACRGIIKNFIFSSSCAVYKPLKNGIVSEISETLPLSIYGKTKLKSEKIIIRESLKYNYNYLILRFFNVAGCDSKSRTGFIKNDHLINTLVKNFFYNKNKIKIFGKNYLTPDGTTIKDYIYIEDLTRCIIKLNNLINKTNKSYILNIGYGKGFSVKKIVQNFAKISGRRIKITYTSPKPGDVSKMIADTKKLNKLLSFKAKKKVMDLIIESSLKWSRTQKYAKCHR
jgi:UDP-glucose 4-epimerase